MKIKILSLLLLLSLLFTGCGVEDKKPTTDQTTVDNTQQETPPERTDFRVLITSDVHCTSIRTWNGMTNEQRMQYWVDCVLAEHQRHPFDLIIFAGDLSLDFHGREGTYSTRGKSETKEFIENYVSQLPENIPKIYLPGNHEAYTNEEWKEITGNDRATSFLLGNNLFVCPDSFNVHTELGTKNEKIECAPTNPYFIINEMNKHLGTNVFLISHYFQTSTESNGFKALVRANKRIVCLFEGHVHRGDKFTLDEMSGKKTVALTGHFLDAKVSSSLGDAWGFRDIVITENSAVTSYYQVKTFPDMNKLGKAQDISFQIKHVYEFTLN